MAPLIGKPFQYTRFTRDLPRGKMLISVDQKACDTAMEQQYIWRVWAVASLQAPTPDGLPMDAESQMLDFSIQELAQNIPEDGETLFLGYIIHAGQFAAIFHSRNAAVLGKPPASPLATSRYEWSIYTAEDSSHEFVRLKLLPTPKEKRRIQDREILDALAQAHDQAHVPRPITFYGLFKSKQDADSASNELDNHGFRTGNASEMPGKSGFKWSLSFTKSAPTEPQIIDEISAAAHDTCVNYGGHYDGWSCEPVEG